MAQGTPYSRLNRSANRITKSPESKSPVHGSFGSFLEHSSMQNIRQAHYPTDSSSDEAFKASGSVQSIGVLKKQLWQVQQIRKEVERKDVVLAEMKLQVEELRKYEQQVDNLKQQLNIYQNNIKTYESEIEELKREETLQNRRFSEKESEMRNQINSLQNMAQKLRDEHSQKVQQLEGEKRILQQEKQKDLAIQNALRKEFDRSEQIIEELKQASNRREQTVQGEFEALKTKSQILLEDNHSLRQQLETCNGRIDSIRQESFSLQKRCQELEKERQELVKQTQEYTSLLEQSQKAIDKLEYHVTIRDEELEKLRPLVEVRVLLEQKCEELKGDLQLLKREQEFKNIEAQQRENDLETCCQEQDEEIRHLKQQVSTLQQEANRVPELIKQLQHLQQNVDFLSNQLGEAEDTITQTSIQLEESKKQEHLQKNRYIRDLDMIVRCSGLIQDYLESGSTSKEPDLTSYLDISHNLNESNTWNPQLMKSMHGIVRSARSALARYDGEKAQSSQLCSQLSQLKQEKSDVQEQLQKSLSEASSWSHSACSSEAKIKHLEQVVERSKIEQQEQKLSLRRARSKEKTLVQAIRVLRNKALMLRGQETIDRVDNHSSEQESSAQTSDDEVERNSNFQLRQERLYAKELHKDQISAEQIRQWVHEVVSSIQEAVVELSHVRYESSNLQRELEEERQKMKNQRGHFTQLLQQNEKEISVLKEQIQETIEYWQNAQMEGEEKSKWSMHKQIMEWEERYNEKSEKVQELEDLIAQSTERCTILSNNVEEYRKERSNMILTIQLLGRGIMPLRAKFTDLVVQKRLLSRWLHEYISFFNATKTALLLAMNSTASSCLIRDGSMTEMNSKISPVYQIVQRLESNFGVSLGKPPHERKSFVGIHRFRILVISVLAALRFGRICSLQLSEEAYGKVARIGRSKISLASSFLIRRLDPSELPQLPSIESDFQDSTMHIMFIQLLDLMQRQESYSSKNSPSKSISRKSFNWSDSATQLTVALLRGLENARQKRLGSPVSIIEEHHQILEAQRDFLSMLIVGLRESERLLGEYSSDQDILQRQFDSVQHQLNMTKSTLEEERAKVRIFEARVRELQDESIRLVAPERANALRESYEQAKREIEQQSTDMKKLKQECKNLRRQLEQTTGISTQYQQQIEHLSKDLDQILQDQDQKQKEVDTLKAELLLREVAVDEERDEKQVLHTRILHLENAMQNEISQYSKVGSQIDNQRLQRTSISSLPKSVSATPQREKRTEPQSSQFRTFYTRTRSSSPSLKLNLKTQKAKSAVQFDES